MATLSPFFKALAASSTATSFGSKTLVTTEPSGAGTHNLQGVPYGLTSEGPGYLHLIPYGTDGENDTFDMRVYGWRKVSGITAWAPYLIVDISIILGNLAADGLGTGNFLADSITLNDGIPAGPFSGILNNSEDLSGGILVHTLGAQYITFDWDLAGGQEAVSMNCLFALIYA